MNVLAQTLLFQIRNFDIILLVIICLSINANAFDENFVNTKDFIGIIVFSWKLEPLFSLEFIFFLLNLSNEISFSQVGEFMKILGLQGF